MGCREMADDKFGALALLDCVHVILAADAQAGESAEFMEEALEGAAAVLVQDAPACAAELPMRWCAAQLAETDCERTAVMEVAKPATTAFYTEEMMPVAIDTVPASASRGHSSLASDALAAPIATGLMAMAGMLAAQPLLQHSTVAAHAQSRLPCL